MRHYEWFSNNLEEVKLLTLLTKARRHTSRLLIRAFLKILLHSFVVSSTLKSMRKYVTNVKQTMNAKYAKSIKAHEYGVNSRTKYLMEKSFLEGFLTTRVRIDLNIPGVKSTASSLSTSRTNPAILVSTRASIISRIIPT